ncbi:hypothetical protein BXZ70DRAFT_1066956 [Cristinia sonorae]|uniref:HTH APSES-type domain-containing protein n=1 Tax=Cristinia sonorae TaxID=1940300 RepID=A0A8K0UKA3_9AGAR|nr:hypothetical protein BXZ70DRAFT_1066956 [Cristinia sonorae]
MPAQQSRPRTSATRPALPTQNANPFLFNESSRQHPPVKFQEIIRDGQATIVGRVKIATPNGHAFILRRLDTGAISLTTMFRASFPSASDEAEKLEAAWVKANFDVSGANKSGKSRFAGTWVSPETARYLAEEYHLSPIIDALSDANPDPNVVYRKSTKTNQTPTASPGATATPTQPQATTTPTQPPAAKRRREASPSGIPVPTRSTPRASAADQPLWTPLTPAATVVATTTSTVTTASVTKTARAPVASVTSPNATRRSTRLRSPAPTAPAAPKTPRTTRASARERERDRDRETPAGSDETAVEHEDDASEEAKVAEMNRLEDVREQKELVERLKAERAVKQKEKEKAAENAMEEDEVEKMGQKRGREDEKAPLQLNIKEPETEDRVIATNRRVSGMTAERKSLVWGALWFAAGLGAVTFMPAIQSLF